MNRFVFDVLQIIIAKMKITITVGLLLLAVTSVLAIASSEIDEKIDQYLDALTLVMGPEARAIEERVSEYRGIAREEACGSSDCK